ncbi:MAG: NlpC/P60 family protein [Alphaproteobacteria bacterium]|nr:NlpC/P60 family protein [Alphaproteobacteria bacterium]
MNDTKQTLVTAARACIGTPFYHQGRIAGIGLDCIGLVIHAVKQIGIPVNDQTDYGREPEGERLHAALIAHGFEQVNDITAGDVLLFRFNGEAQHVGLAVSHDAMVHAYAPIGRVVETGLGETWQRRIAGIYRAANIEEL